MTYVLDQAAKAIVASAVDFVRKGLLPAPDTQIEGRYDVIMRHRDDRAMVMSRMPATVQILNSWTIEGRVAWLLHNFESDERYAHAWNLSRSAMQARPITFALFIESAWRRRADQAW